MSNPADLAMNPKRDGWMSRVALVLLGLVLGAVVTCAYPIALPGEPTIRMKVDGQAVSRKGGVKVALREDGWRLDLTCNGACDDVYFDARTGDGLFSLNIVDAQGKCLVCNTKEYVTPGLTAEWNVTGRDKLTVRNDAGVEHLGAATPPRPTPRP